MKRILLAIACVASAAPAQQAPRLGLEHAMQLRCSAAFGIIAGEQARGVSSALEWPPLEKRGKEFFVRAAAGMMDDLGLTREQVEALLNAEAELLQREAMEAADAAAYVRGVMEPCLLALDASGV